jgi:acyl dehydratase
MSTAPVQAPAFADVAVGDPLPVTTVRLTRADLIRYAGASGDLNPIHWNERFARGVGLPDVIAHGMLTMAVAVTPVTDWCGDPGAVVEYSARFTNLVVVPDDELGATVEIAGTVTARDEQERTVRVDLVATSAGVKVLGRATAVVRLP